MGTFNTERLKELSAYAIKGAGFDKLLELSNYLGIRVSKGMLYLNTTDGTNYLCVSDVCSADDMDITVDADLFAKLIGKINSDVVELQVVDNALVVKGNGKYTLAVQPDEEGNMLSFPNKFPDKVEHIGTIAANDLITINSAIKASLSSVAGSIYSNYYIGDVVASTDKAMMGIFNKKILDTPYLINNAVIDIMSTTIKDVDISKSDTMLVFESKLSENSGVCLCTAIQADVDKFNVDAINKFASMEVTSFCRFKRAQMLELLDRLSLFVSKFEDGAIELHFTDEYIEVSSMSSNSIERVEYTESKDTKDITIKININRFRNQLKAYGADIVDLYYGNEICIKLVDGDTTQIIALIK